MIIKDVRDAQILVELATQLSFAGAARNLGVPAATLSRRVAEMERHAGLRLFERTTRAVTITEAGEVALEYAARILAEVDGVQRSMEERRGAPVGRVRISAPNILGQHALRPIAGRFLADFPGCDLVMDLSNRRVDLVEERFDFVVRVGDLQDTEFISQFVGHVTAGIYRRFGALHDAAPFRSPADLEDRAAGLLRSDHVRRSVLHLRRGDSEEASCTVRARLVALNPWLLVDVARASDLVVVLPRFVGDPLVASSTLEKVLPDWSVVEAPVHILYPSKRNLRPATRECIDVFTRDLKRVLQ